MFLEQLTFWHWFAVSAVLMLLELFAPGVAFLWLGIAAAITGGVLWSVPTLPWEAQMVVFAVLAVIAMVVGRAIYRARKKPSDQPLLNQRGAQYVGNIYTLDNSMANGHAKVRIGDTLWSVQMSDTGPDLPEGEFVKVVGFEGSTLVVEPAADRHWRQDVQPTSV